MVRGRADVPRRRASLWVLRGRSGSLPGLRLLCPHRLGGLTTKEGLVCRSLPAGDVLWRVPWSGENMPTLLFSPDGRHLAALASGEAEFRDAGTGGLVRKFGTYESWPWNQPPAAFRPDGLALACRWASGIDILRPETGDILAKFSGDGGHCPIAFTPDGRFLAAGTDNGRVRFWDARTWKSRGALKPGVGRVRGLAFSPDGMTAAVAGDGGKVVILDLIDLDAELLAGRRNR